MTAAPSSIVLRYRNYRVRATGVTYLLPMVWVVLVHNKRIWKVPALLDSGATQSFLPRHIAENLGLDLAGEAEHALGAGGTFRYIPTLLEGCQLVDDEGSVFGRLQTCTSACQTTSRTPFSEGTISSGNTGSHLMR